MAKANLVDIATSGASLEVSLELMAKHIEKRLQALESMRGADYESKVERMLAEMMQSMGEMKPTINVPQAAAPKVTVDAPVVNVTPNIVVQEKESKTMKIMVERGLSGSIESLTVIKG